MRRAFHQKDSPSSLDSRSSVVSCSRRKSLQDRCASLPILHRERRTYCVGCRAMIAFVEQVPQSIPCRLHRHLHPMHSLHRIHCFCRLSSRLFLWAVLYLRFPKMLYDQGNIVQEVHRHLYYVDIDYIVDVTPQRNCRAAVFSCRNSRR